MKRRLDHLVDRFLLEPPPPSARAALRVGAHQLLHLDTPPHAAVSATVAAAPKRFRGLVNAVLRKVAAAVETGVQFPSVGIELSYPDWIVERLTADLGLERGRSVETMNSPAGVHARDDGYVKIQVLRRLQPPSLSREATLSLTSVPHRAERPPLLPGEVLESLLATNAVAGLAL